jgi:hypothetical protein
MRMTSRPWTGALLALLFTVLASGLLAGPAAASPALARPAAGRSVASAMAHPAVVHSTAGGVLAAGAITPPTGVTPGPGPDINQQIQNADADVAHRKIVVGVIVVVLLVIVYFGHRAQKKHKIRLKKAASGS